MPTTTGHDLSTARLDEELTEEASCGDLQSEVGLWVSVSIRTLSLNIKWICICQRLAFYMFLKLVQINYIFSNNQFTSCWQKMHKRTIYRLMWFFCRTNTHILSPNFYDWLIDWCLTPTLAVFQLYCGMKKFPNFYASNK